MHLPGSCCHIASGPKALSVAEPGRSSLPRSFQKEAKQAKQIGIGSAKELQLPGFEGSALYDQNAQCTVVRSQVMDFPRCFRTASDPI